MINVFDYENKNVIVECTDGRVYKGHVDWCVRAIDSDEEEDMLSVSANGVFPSEIKSIEVIDDFNSEDADKANKTA